MGELLDDVLYLGPCCCCGKEAPYVCNVVTLPKKSPIPGRGWGCFICKLPPDGAGYICCDECLEKNAKPKWACRGYPGIDGQIPIEELTEDFDHDYSLHAPQIQWFTTSPDAGDPDCLCSLCLRLIEAREPLRILIGEIWDDDENEELTVEARFHMDCFAMYQKSLELSESERL